MNNTEAFDVELLKQLRELGATEVTFPNGARVVFPAAVVKTVDVQAKVAKERKQVDPDAARYARYAAIMGSGNE